MKKNDPPIQAIAAVTCSQRRRIDPHSQIYGPQAAIRSSEDLPQARAFAPTQVRITAAPLLAHGEIQEYFATELENRLG